MKNKKLYINTTSISNEIIVKVISKLNELKNEIHSLNEIF